MKILYFNRVYTSQDIQELITNAGQEMTILADDSIKGQFGTELDVYEGKNIQAIFEIPSGTPPEKISKYNQYVKFEIDEFINSNKDVNQHIREVAENAEIEIKNASGNN